MGIAFGQLEILSRALWFSNELDGPGLGTSSFSIDTLVMIVFKTSGSESRFCKNMDCCHLTGELKFLESVSDFQRLFYLWVLFCCFFFFLYNQH